MQLFRRILAAFGAGGLANKEKGRQSSGAETRSTEANIVVTDERAMAVSAVFACVRILVQAGATLPLHVYRRTPDGREQVDDHPLSRLLTRRPNALMNAREFRQAMWVQRVLWGNAYALVTRNGEGTPVALMPLKPEYMSVDRKANSIEYIYSAEGGERKYSQEQILHLRGFSPDGVIGLSPLSYARQSLGISVSADRYASRSFTGRPNGVLTVEKFLTDDQRKQIRDLYTNIGNSSVGDGSWWLA